MTSSGHRGPRARPRARGPRLIDTEFEDGHRYYTKEAHVADLAEPDTAFSNRGYLLWLNFAMRWDDPADDADYIGRTRMIVAALGRWVGRGVYVNMLNFDEQDRVV